MAEIKNNKSNPAFPMVLKGIEEGKLSPALAVRKMIELEHGREGSLGYRQNQEQNFTLEEIIKELDSMIGLDNVKELVKELIAYIEIQKRRKSINLSSDNLELHMIFSGNPGTGKTTVARLLGKMLKKMDILQKGHLVEVERADLVGEYIGHTAQKMRDQIKKALGGILFIDEAYSLARGGEKDFGKEAIDTLVKAMEDHKESFILVLAGYRDEMENFLRINPGLKSRFPIHIEFKDYGIEELLKIADLFAEKRQYVLTKGAKAKIGAILSKNAGGLIQSGNARLIRNIIEKSLRKQAVRLMKSNNLTKEDLISIQREDISEVD